MGCGCGTPRGFVRVWQHIVNGQVDGEYETQAAANGAKAAMGGKGRVQRVTRKSA